MADVLWLDEVGASDLPRTGAKAFTLARLRREGLPVPDGFVLLAADASLAGARADAVREAYARLGGRVAVRSSSTLEDTATASFAGQYRTVLDVEGASAVLDAARASLASAAASAGYARALGVTRPGAMAVLVQRFVHARAAGVAFTRHPQDARAWLVESHAGGQAVVAGTVSPDRYFGTRDGGAAAPGPRGGSLAEAELGRVIAIARRAEEVLGAPQDVEWALDGDGVWLLQSRPITTDADEAALDPRIRRLSRANVGEVLPHAVTPLTATTVVAVLEHGFQAVTGEAGLRPREAPPLLVLHRRHLYLNVSLSADVATRLPGIRAEDAERLVLGGGHVSGRLRLAGAGAPRVLAVALRLLRLARRLPAEVEACAELVARLPAPDAILAAGADGLARLLDAFMETGRRVATAHIATSGASAVRLALLERIVSVVGGGAAAGRVSRLLAGLDGLESADPATELEHLAAEAARRPDWRAWLARPPAVAAVDLRSLQVPSDLGERLRAFLVRYGHRAVSEGELRAQAWEDDPAPVFEALQAMLEAPLPPGFARAAAGELRRAEEEALRGPLGLVRGALVRYALDAARRGIAERERTKSMAIGLVRHGRRLARAAALRLAAAGAIASPDDVFFLTFDELTAALAGGPVPRAAIEERRRRHEREDARGVPREVDLEGTRATATAPASSDDGAALTGIGVSGGWGAGPARVLAHGEAARLEPGEVLVAPVLDAAYAPLLAVASGAVAEVGGLLSHGSVVARELGVPCVVDVREATRRVATGEQVKVDGDAGLVTRIGPAAAATAPGARPALLEQAPDEHAGPHALEDHPLARESVYFNVQDPATGLVVVASLGRRRHEAGESLLAIGLPDGRVLFGLDRAPASTAQGLAVATTLASWRPVALRATGRLSAHESVDFPRPPLPLLLAPRTTSVELELAFLPASPAVDLCAALTPEERDLVRPLGAHHVEQSGTWAGTLRVDDRSFPISGTGSRDHSWGLRDWDAAGYWRLFTARLGEDLAVHALCAGVRGRLVQGGFVWRDGRVERVTRVRWSALRRDRPDAAGHGASSDGAPEGALRSFDLEVTTAAGPPLRLRGTVARSLTVPVQVDRRPWRHLGGRPYRLLLEENFTRYEGESRCGFGMAERTRRQP